MKKLIIFFLVFGGTGMSRADVLTEGQTEKAFRISNTQNYNDYHFFYYYQHYYYSYGYKRGKPEKIPVKQGMAYYAGPNGRSEECQLMATRGSDTEKVFVSDIFMGGSVIDHNASSICEVFEIAAIRNDTIFLKKIKTVKKNKNSKDEGFISLFPCNSPPSGKQKQLMLALVSVILLGVLYFIRKGTLKPKFHYFYLSKTPYP